jgi:hypothetical protein
LLVFGFDCSNIGRFLHSCEGDRPALTDIYDRAVKGETVEIWPSHQRIPDGIDPTHVPTRMGNSLAATGPTGEHQAKPEATALVEGGLAG